MPAVHTNDAAATRASPQSANPGPSFAALPLSPAMLSNLHSLGYTSMTPVQAASLPLALQGHDVVAQAQTGSGKTAAFALALLARLQPQTLAVQALVLCPTRELADQVTQEIRRLARALDNIKVLTLCGGVALRGQVASLAHGAHVVVGTPGRVMDHLQRQNLALQGLNTLVLDEADRMLEMGFFDDIATIAKQCPAARQTLLFSATYPEGIGKISAQFMRQPHSVKVQAQVESSQIHQRWFEVAPKQRLQAVVQVLHHYRPTSTLAFCNTKQQCRQLLAVLQQEGFVALALYGELEQRERDQVLVQFANRSCSVLVATDVAARGLDISQLPMVVNVDVALEAQVHIHRVGRTGRANEEGWAMSLASMDEMGQVGKIELLQKQPSQWERLDALTHTNEEALVPPMLTLQLVGGRKEKIRAGDVLGALTGEVGLTREQVGKINVNEFSTYVAIDRHVARATLQKLSAGKIKGKNVKVRLLDPTCAATTADF